MKPDFSTTSMTSRTLWIISLLLSGVLFSSFRAKYLPEPANDLVSHSYYTLSYNKVCKEPNWVYYLLTDSMVLNKGQERTNRFLVDKSVPGGSASTSDYTKSGYDRGHLCPAADMGFNARAMEESFLMSNITPQAPDFNRGIWKELETDVRDWALKNHRLIVIAGPVFRDDKGTIGSDKVVVPGYFFKIIFASEGTPRMIAFLIPNARTDRPVADFAVSVDKIENLTGYDFFSQLPDEEENKLESNVTLTGWFREFQQHDNANEQPKSVAKTEHSDKQFYFFLILALGLVILFVFLKGRKK